jgi:hypothetical protein
MSKKLLITIAAVVIIAGIFGINSLSLKNVSLDFKRDGFSATILNDKGKVVKEVPAGTGEKSVKLKKGSYGVVPKGTNIDDRALPLTVTASGGSIEVDPGYSKEHLQDLLKEEDAAIKSLLATTYPGVIDSFTVNPGELYFYGEWYATTLVQQSPGPGSNGDVYRTVLHKENGVWRIAAPPALILSTKEYPSIPRIVLNTINLESGY